METGSLKDCDVSISFTHSNYSCEWHESLPEKAIPSKDPGTPKKKVSPTPVANNKGKKRPYEEDEEDEETNVNEYEEDEDEVVVEKIDDEHVMLSIIQEDFDDVFVQS